MATPIGDSYTCASGGTIAAGRFVAPAAPSQWSQLTITPYSFIPTRGADGNPRYDSGASVAQTDAGGAITASVIPFREFSKPSATDNGVLYYHGGLHSGYAGNDILKITLGPSLSVQQLARPHVPNAGDPGFSTSSTGSLWKDNAPALAVGDRDQWQPYTFHNYCKNTWHPRFGYLLTNFYPVSWDGNGYPVSSHATYGDYDSRAQGTLIYNESTNRYTVLSTAPTGYGINNISDYCNEIDGVISISEAYGSFQVLELSERTNDAWAFQRAITPDTATGIAAQGNAANGINIKTLEGRLFVLVNNVDANYWIWTYNHETGATSAVALPVANSGYHYTIAVDRAGRRLFCAVIGAGALRVFRSVYGALSSWTELTLLSAPTVSGQFGREAMWLHGGKLYYLDFYANAYYCTALDDSRPTVSATKVPVNFISANSASVADSKHTNLAYRPDDGCVYFHGGDVVESYSQEMFKYHVATDTWTQIQNRCGADPSGNANGIRPLNPDDGGWFWDTTEAKFWWFPGGGMLGQSDGSSYVRKCSDMPTLEEWSTLYATHGSNLQADGRSDLAIAFNALGRWKVYTPMQFDATAGTWSVIDFTATNTAGWGASTLSRFWGGEQGRGNAYDPVARKFFRIVLGGGFNLFVADLAAKTWRPFTCARLADGTYFNDSDLQSLSYGMQSFAVDSSNGRLYGVRGATGDLFYIDTRGTPILHDGGPTYRLPIYVLANPITPAPGSHGSDHNFMRIYKGGLLFWYVNPNGATSDIRGAWWRSLSGIETSHWVPVQFPFEMTGNSISTNEVGTNQYFVMGPPSVAGQPGYAWTIS